MTITKKKLFLGQQPTRILLADLKNEAFNEIITKSPLNFKLSTINFVAIYRDGFQIPAKPLQPDFENDRFIRSYMRLFTQTGQYYRNTGNGISREQYKNGCAIFAFDLTPQMNFNDDCFELIKSVNFREEIYFAAAVAATLTILVFAEFDSLLQIYSLGSAAFDYTQIERILRRDPYCKKIFKGVYASDQIKRFSYPSAYVINSDPSTRPGKHWIAVFFDRRGNGQYFDNYDIPPKVPGFTEFMNRNSKKWKWNRKAYKEYILSCVVNIVYILCYLNVVVYLCAI